jgi:hypothetical protein
VTQVFLSRLFYGAIPGMGAWDAAWEHWQFDGHEATMHHFHFFRCMMLIRHGTSIMHSIYLYSGVLAIDSISAAGLRQQQQV